MFIDSGDKQKEQGTGRISINCLTWRMTLAVCAAAVITRKARDKNSERGTDMKKTARSDSQADAVAAVLLVVLAVAFAVVWVAGQ